MDPKRTACWCCYPGGAKTIHATSSIQGMQRKHHNTQAESFTFSCCENIRRVILVFIVWLQNELTLHCP